MILCIFSKFIRLDVLFCTHLATISHISNFHYEFYRQIAIPHKSYRVILCRSSKFIRPDVLFRTYLAPISHVSNFHYKFHNQIVTPKSFRVILCMFSKFIRSGVLFCTHRISHISRTFQTFTMSFTIKLLPLLGHLEWFCICLVSLLGWMFYFACISHTSRRHLTRFKLSLLVSKATR